MTEAPRSRLLKLGDGQQVQPPGGERLQISKKGKKGEKQLEPQVATFFRPLYPLVAHKFGKSSWKIKVTGDPGRNSVEIVLVDFEIHVEPKKGEDTQEFSWIFFFF